MSSCADRERWARTNRMRRKLIMSDETLAHRRERHLCAGARTDACRQPPRARIRGEDQHDRSGADDPAHLAVRGCDKSASYLATSGWMSSKGRE